MINFDITRMRNTGRSKLPKKEVQCVSFVRTKFITTDQLRNHKDNEDEMKNNEINPTNELKSNKCDVCAKIFTIFGRNNNQFLFVLKVFLGQDRIYYTGSKININAVIASCDT